MYGFLCGVVCVVCFWCVCLYVCVCFVCGVGVRVCGAVCCVCVVCVCTWGVYVRGVVY